MPEKPGFPAAAILLIAFFFAPGPPAAASWLATGNIAVKMDETEFGGTRLVLEYDLNAEGITVDHPAWVFIHYRDSRAGKGWRRLPQDILEGGGAGLVRSHGRKQVVIWGARKFLAVDPGKLEFQVRGIPLARVPAGKFIRKTPPGSGYGPGLDSTGIASLPEFFIARHETTLAMYADYLNDRGAGGAGWSEKMTDSLHCGILRPSDSPPFSYTVIQGREDYPVTTVSWYEAREFLGWCGLELPTESQWEKAFRGGLFLDGDSLSSRSNPLPERTYPWGNEPPSENGLYRCNVRGGDDGFPGTAGVFSFPEYLSPYGVFGLAGNVAEWTRDWYTTTYHTGLDGFRMLRGGSWKSPAVSVDAISGATSLPVRESPIMGFRGVLEPLRR